MARTHYTPSARWADAIEAFERSQRADGYAEETVMKRCDHMSKLSRSVDVSPWEMTFLGIVHWLDSLGMAKSTRADHRMSARSFYRWAARTGRIEVDPTEEPGGTASELPVPEVWVPILKAFRTFLRMSGKPETTVKIRMVQIRRFARDHWSLDPFDVTLDDLVEWLGSKRWKTETRRSHRSALRTFYGWAVATERMEVDPSVHLPIVKPGQIRPNPAGDEDYRRALDQAQPRERLALQLGAELGLRCGEIVKVHSRDLCDTPGAETLVVHGKGDKDRILPIPRFIAVQLSGLPEGYAFPGNIEGHLSTATLGKAVSALLPEGFASHSLRHRFATRMYDHDRDVFSVQQLLGHASPETTRRYVKTSDATLRRLVDTVSAGGPDY